MNPHYPAVADRARNRCEYCRAPEALFNFSFEVEHIFPSAEGGTSGLDNLALCCRSCNVHKSKSTAADDEVTGERVRLFHPRLDAWNEHFVVAADFSIVGISPIGRVTVSRLQMNSTRQMSSRRKWRMLGQFP